MKFAGKSGKKLQRRPRHLLSFLLSWPAAFAAAFLATNIGPPYTPKSLDQALVARARAVNGDNDCYTDMARH